MEVVNRPGPARGSGSPSREDEELLDLALLEGLVQSSQEGIEYEAFKGYRELRGEQAFSLSPSHCT